MCKVKGSIPLSAGCIREFYKSSCTNPFDNWTSKSIKNLREANQSAPSRRRILDCAASKIIRFDIVGCRLFLFKLGKVCICSLTT